MIFFLLGVTVTSVSPSFSLRQDGSDPSISSPISLQQENVSVEAEVTHVNTEKISPSQELGRGYKYLLLLGLIDPVSEGDNLQTTYMTRVFRDKETLFSQGEENFTCWSAQNRCL